MSRARHGAARTQRCTGSHALLRGAAPALALTLCLPHAHPALADAGAAASDEIETVVITAERLETLDAERALTPGGVTVIDGGDLHERTVAGLADMLRYAPGVWSESASGSDELFFSSRGSNLDATDYDRNGVKLLQDGLPVTTADGNNHNRVVDPLAARYAVVARGANALAYGASTLGGAIDFISPTARGGEQSSAFVNGGSHGLLSARASAGLVSDRLDGLATIESRTWDGYRAHSAQRRSGLYANGGWRNVDDTRSARVFATWVHNEQQLPGALTRVEAEADPDQASRAALSGDYRKDVRTWRLAAVTSWQPDSRRKLDLGVSWEEQALYHPIVDRILVDFDGPGPGEPVEVFSLLVDTDHRDLGAMLRYNLRAGSHDVLIGADYGDGTVKGGNYRNDGGRRNGLRERVDNAADSFEAYVIDRWRLGRSLTLAYGAQYVTAGRDVRTTDAATGNVRNPRARYSAVNPRAGAIYAPGPRAELYGNVSRLLEAPTTYELEDDARGNDATLDPMTGTAFEAGVRSRAAGSDDRLAWHWDVTVYYARIDDEILSVDDPAAPGNSLSTNVDRTIHAGIEALVGARIALGDGPHRLEPLLSLTVNDFAFDDDPIYGDNALPAAPEYALRGELMYRRGDRFHAGPTFDLVGKRFADFSNTYEVDGYVLLGFRWGFGGRTWDVFGEMRNVLDEEYVATLGVLNAAPPDARVIYPGTPRSAYVGARVRF